MLHGVVGHRARLEGVGGSRITVDGVDSLGGVEFTFADDFHEVATFLAMGDLFAFPSHQEGFPLALLEAMAEHQVTLDGTTRPLPDPFFVIATQNPVDLSGTYPLPDSQLDRFLLRLTLGYPNAESERALLAGTDRRELIAQTGPLLSDTEVLALRTTVNEVHASDALVNYVQALLARSRQHPGVRVGLSPRAGIALLRAARAYALLLGREHVLPEDVQALFAAVAAHRLVAEAEASSVQALAKSILHAVPVD